MPEEQVKALLGALPIPALVVDADERVGGINRPASDLLGERLEKRHYITALRQPALLDVIEGVLAGGPRASTSWLDADGDRDTTWQATVAPFAGGVLVCFEDRTEVEEAGQARRDFVANVSHELRTPLTALMGFIDTLRGAARSDPAAQERFLAIMAREAERMNRLIHDLLSLSRVEANERVRPTGNVDLRGILNSVVLAIQPQAAAVDITVRANFRDGDPVYVPGDNDQLSQVFTNLVENAVKYGGSKVTIALQIEDRALPLRGPAVSVEVRDDGPGIAAIHLPRLTQRFYRVDPHRSREIGGTGLGLAIVKHIVGRHRGRLRIASTPGEGSTFCVLLPLAGASAESPAAF